METLAIRVIQYSRTMIRPIDGQTIHDLKESMKQHGLLQPIVVYLNEKQEWEVICGNHRLCAAKGLGWDQIPVIMKQCTPSDAVILSLTENIQRLNMNPVREGELFATMKYDPETIAKKLGKSKQYVDGRIQIYKNLHPKLKEEIGKSLGVMNAIFLSKLPQSEQLIIYAKIKAVSDVHLQPQKLYGGYGGGYIPSDSSPYCICDKCGSKHLRSVSIGDEKRAEKILSALQE
ncbi:MAG: ParB/RepB/Spo0J family partition protein [Candidatus Bathyarchaeia archaeon]|jgi:ParB family chromosome partitioning protein